MTAVAAVLLVAGLVVGFLFCHWTEGRSLRQLNARLGARCTRALDDLDQIRARYSLPRRQP